MRKDADNICGILKSYFITLAVKTSKMFCNDVHECLKQNVDVSIPFQNDGTSYEKRMSNGMEDLAVN